MKIRTKLLAGLIALLVVTMLQTGMGIFQSFTVNEIGEQLRHHSDVQSTAFHIQRMTKDESISLRNMLVMEDSESIEREIARIDELHVEIQAEIDRLESVTDDAKLQQYVQELIETNRVFYQYLIDVINLVRDGRQAEAGDIVLAQGDQMQVNFFNAISAITDNYEAQMQESLVTMDQVVEPSMVVTSILSLLIAIAGIYFVNKSIWSVAQRLNHVSRVMTRAAHEDGGLSTRIEVTGSDEIDDVADSFNHMAASLDEQMAKEQEFSRINQEQNWVKTNIADITTALNGLHGVESIASHYLSRTVPLIEGSNAVFYLKSEEEEEQGFRLLAAYAYKERALLPEKFMPGEGLVGQAAVEKMPILLTDVPPDYIRIRSGLGEASPSMLYVVPVLLNGEVLAVVEYASFKLLTPNQQALLDELVRNLSIILDSAMSRSRLAQLLEESQMLTEELQAQSEELQSQQEELRAANEELETQTQALRGSEERLQYQQEELEQSNIELVDKANILEKQNKLLEETNLEIERARAELETKARELAVSSKYKSEFLANMSHELRTPLNSMLILSKLLADNPDGNLTDKQSEFARTVYSSGCDLLAIINDILDLAKVESGKAKINPSLVAVEELLTYARSQFQPVAAEKGIGFHVEADERMPSHLNSDEQRLQQVLSNLLGNAFKFTEQGQVTLTLGIADEGAERFYIAVRDSGIGIPEDKQEMIFQAFQQADGTTSRKYGGTGLGLSICREIAKLLGGEITVASQEGEGSTFTFYFGDGTPAESGDQEAVRYVMDAGQRLTIANEAAAASESIDTAAAADTAAAKAKHKDAVSNRHIKRLMIVDDDRNQRSSLMELVGSRNVVITAVATGREAIEELKVRSFDCMVLDLGLSDTSGFELLERMKKDRLSDNIKIFIYTGRDLSSKEEIFLKKFAHTIIIKDEHAPERLLGELDMYLQAEPERPDASAEGAVIAKQLHDLEGKRLLLVDDDVRNVFALTNILEMHGMKVSFAENGIEGLRVLQSSQAIDVVLMDIMMPEMDGYETMRRIRAIPAYKDLPVIALTAKAMREDREKCIEAGASDYIVKPVNSDQLLSLIQVWLYPESSDR
jgi:signal transduction histidine kinase/DNA-binding response OmpR family regulator/CHASE3 domain sensor protein